MDLRFGSASRHNGQALDAFHLLRTGLWMALLGVLCLALGYLFMGLGISNYLPNPLLLGAFFAAFYFPFHAGVLWAWIYGFIADVVLDSPLGTYALLSAVSVYLLRIMHPKLRAAGFLNTFLVLFVLLLLQNLTAVFLIQSFNAASWWQATLASIFPVIISMFLWFVGDLFMRYLKNDATNF